MSITPSSHILINPVSLLGRVLSQRFSRPNLSQVLTLVLLYALLLQFLPLRAIAATNHRALNRKQPGSSSSEQPSKPPGAQFGSETSGFVPEAVPLEPPPA